MSNKKKGGQIPYRPQNQNRPNEEKKNPIGRTLSTPSGFKYTLVAKNLQDMRFLDALIAMEDTSLPEAERVVNMVRLLRLMLGEDQKDALYAHVVKQHGWASPAAVGTELKAIISNFDESKKKS